MISEGGACANEGATMYLNPCPSVGGVCGAVVGLQVTCSGRVWTYTGSGVPACQMLYLQYDAANRGGILGMITGAERAKNYYRQTLGCNLP